MSRRTRARFFGRVRARRFCAGSWKLSAPRIVDDLIELDLGRWEGESYDSLMEKEPERLRAHYANFVRSRAPEGESVMDLARRVRPALRCIREANASAGRRSWRRTRR